MSSKTGSIPELDSIQSELNREKYKRRYLKVLKNTVFSLVTVAAIAILVATTVLPVLQIYGTSMKPTLEEGNIVVSVKTHEYKQGEIVSFYYNNKILVKRVVATAGQWVDMDESGQVFVNGKAIDEPYLTETAFGECDQILPYQVPDGKIFVMGDHRATSVDSRSKTIGCVSEEQLVGKIVFRVWPLTDFGEIT